MPKTQPIPTDDEIIDLYCTAVQNAATALASQKKVALFLGNQLYGKRVYDSHEAAALAVSKLTPRLMAQLKTEDAAKVAFATRKLVRDTALRRKAIETAYSKELFYVGRAARPNAHVTVK